MVKSEKINNKQIHVKTLSKKNLENKIDYLFIIVVVIKFTIEFLLIRFN